MPASADTFLRLMHRHRLPEVGTPRVLGVDGWAWKRGRVWGTLLVDLERHRPVDLLPDRMAAILAAWLRIHLGIEITTRDRSTEYTRGITQGAPTALHVADRGHLLHNLRQVLERFFHAAHARLRRLPGLPAAEHQPQGRSGSEVVVSEAARQQRYKRHEEARRRHEEEGLNPLQLARALGINPKTARKHLSAPAFPEWTPHPRMPSILQPYEAYLDIAGARGAAVRSRSTARSRR